MNETAVCIALGVTLLQLYALRQNSQFPTPAGELWDSGAITAFAATMASALANWPSLTPSGYASANWSELAATSPGAYTPSPGGLMGGASRSGIYGNGAAPTGVYGRGGPFD